MEAYRQPQQARSQRTLDAILDAAEALLERQPFDQISIAEIILEAGSSTGSFYARFPSKDALLPALYARYHESLPARVARARRALESKPHTLAQVSRRVVAEMAESFETRRNLMQAVTLYARRSPADTEPFLGERTSLHQEMVELFAPYQRQIRHRDWREAVRAGLFVAGAAIREAVLFPAAPFAAATNQPLPRMKEAIAAMLVAYLASAPE